MSGIQFIAPLVIGSMLSIVPALLSAADDTVVTVQEDENSFVSIERHEKMPLLSRDVMHCVFTAAFVSSRSRRRFGRLRS